jgi:hypothetical protein
LKLLESEIEKYEETDKLLQEKWNTSLLESEGTISELEQQLSDKSTAMLSEVCVAWENTRAILVDKEREASELRSKAENLED